MDSFLIFSIFSRKQVIATAMAAKSRQQIVSQLRHDNMATTNVVYDTSVLPVILT